MKIAKQHSKEKTVEVSMYNYDSETSLNESAAVQVVNLLATLFNTVAYMRQDYIEASLLFASGDDYIHRNYRVWSKEWHDYFLENFRSMYLLLISDDDIRYLMKEAMLKEMEETENFESFVIPMADPELDSFVLDLSVLDEDRYLQLSKFLNEEFAKKDTLSNMIDECASKLDDFAKYEIGEIVSRFTFLFMAIAHDSILRYHLEYGVESIKFEVAIEDGDLVLD